MSDNRRNTMENIASSRTEVPSVWESLAILADRLIQRSETYYIQDYPYPVKEALCWTRQAIDIREKLIGEAKAMLIEEESTAGEEWEKRILAMQRTLPFAYGLCGDMCRHEAKYEEAVVWYRKALATLSVETMDIPEQAEKILFLYVKTIECLRHTPATKTREGQIEERELICKARRLKEELRKRMGTRKCLQMFYDWADGLWLHYGTDEDRLREVAGQLYGIYLWFSDTPEDWRMMHQVEKEFHKKQRLEEPWDDDQRESKYLRAKNPWRLCDGPGKDLCLRPMGWLEWKENEYVAAIPWSKDWSGEPNMENMTFWKIGPSDIDEYALRVERVTDRSLASALEQQYRQQYANGFLAEPVITRQLIDFRKMDLLTEKKKIVMRKVAKVLLYDMSYNALCDLQVAGYCGFEQGAYTRTLEYLFRL